MAQITKTNVGTIRADIEAALKAVAAKHGVDFQLGRITYNADTLSGKLTGTARGAQGTDATKAADPLAVALAKYSMMEIGSKVDPKDKYNGGPALGLVRIVGYNTRAKAYPFIVQQVYTGMQYKLDRFTTKAIVNNGVTG